MCLLLAVRAIKQSTFLRYLWSEAKLTPKHRQVIFRRDERVELTFADFFDGLPLSDDDVVTQNN
jgi:hypothetical protein